MLVVEKVSPHIYLIIKEIRGSKLSNVYFKRPEKGRRGTGESFCLNVQIFENIRANFIALFQWRVSYDDSDAYCTIVRGIRVKALS